MSDTSAGKQQGQNPSVPAPQVYCRALSNLLDRAPLQRDSGLLSESARARWPSFVQGRAVLDSHHHGAIRAFRSFANDAGPTPVLPSLACLCDVAASLYANTDRPVRADILEAIAALSCSLIPLLSGPAAAPEDVLFGLLGVSSCGEVRLQDYVSALLDDLATGPPHVRPMLGLQLCSLLGSLARVVPAIGAAQLRVLLSPAKSHLACVASAAVFAGTVGPIALAAGSVLTPPSIVISDAENWGLRATFQPAFRVVLSSKTTSARFTASGSAVSTLCAVFLSEPTGPTCGPPGLCLVYPRPGAQGALRGSRGEIPLTTASFSSMQRLVHRYYEDSRRIHWAAYIHALYGDI